MSDHPILFQPAMIRAIAHGKSHTRRLPNGKRGVRVQLPRDVRGDYPFHTTLAKAGTYRAKVNPLGAVSVKAQDGSMLGIKPDEYTLLSPYGQRGDHLWVRENIRIQFWNEDGTITVEYPADGAVRDIPVDSEVWNNICEKYSDIAVKLGARDGILENGEDPEAYYLPDGVQFPITPSIHMPRWASRITLENLGVHLEPLADISEVDAQREGALTRMVTLQGGIVAQRWHMDWDGHNGPGHRRPREAFLDYVSHIHDGDLVKLNPVMYVVSFRLTEWKT